MDTPINFMLIWFWKVNDLLNILTNQSLRD